MIFSSHEPKAHNVSYSIPIEPLSACLCVRVSTLSNINISATRRPIAIKFYLKHHWGWEMAAIGFRLLRIRTLVSMATDCSRRVLMGKCCKHSSAFIFDRIFLILASNKDIYNISNDFELRQDRTKDFGVSCP